MSISTQTTPQALRISRWLLIILSLASSSLLASEPTVPTIPPDLEWERLVLKAHGITELSTPVVPNDISGILTGDQPVPETEGVAFADINPSSSTLDPSDPDGASGGRCNGLATVAGSTLVYYVASEFGGVFKTTDGGLTWFRLNGHKPTDMWDVEVDSSNVNRVYATSLYDGKVTSVSGIQISTDAGATWAHPLTGHPAVALEGTVSDNTPQAGFFCQNPRDEPSAFGIGIRPDAQNNVAIGTSCGVAISTDSGATWQFVDPTPANGADRVWDVVFQAGGPTGQGIIDICGDEGHFRSTDGGANWTGGAAGLPRGRCSIAVSPDENYVLFVAAADNFIYESDDAGATWTNLGSPDVRVQGRIPFVAANQRSNAGANNVFDLWFGDVTLFRGNCVSGTAQGGANRCSPTYIGFCAGFCDDGTTACNNNNNCQGIGSGNCNGIGITPCANNAACTGVGPQQCVIGARPIPYVNPANWFGPFTRSVGAHDDAGDIVFNPTVAVDACPVLFTSDGGVYWNTDTGGDCQNPNWEQPNTTPHALWLWTMDGVDVPGVGTEHLYFGVQDNGTFAALNASAGSPTWVNGDCCDGFDIVADATRVVSTLCCGFSIRRSGPGLSGTTAIANNPPGNAPTFNFPDFIDQFGNNLYIAVTTGGSGGGYITTDITASPTVWTQLGAASTPAGGFCGVQVSLSGTTPTFYARTGCNVDAATSQIWKYVGTNVNSTWTRIDNNDGLSGGFGVFAPDPVNPNRLYGCNTAVAGPQMVFSTDGGLTWDADTDLDKRMTGGGLFKYQHSGIRQPTLVAFDPENPNIVVAAGRDSGLFLSRNGGGTWSLLSDPLNSDITGIPHLPRPRFAFFDHEANPDEVQIYIGTQGRGVWRITVPLDVPVLTIPSDVFFADTCVGTVSHSTLYVCNTGKKDLSVGPITTTNSHFAVIPPSSGYPVIISPDFCFPFRVRFSPTASGDDSTTFFIPSNDPVCPTNEVQAFGKGLKAEISVFIANAGNFGEVCIGSFKDLDLTINNPGGCPLLISNITSTSPHFIVPVVLDYPLIVHPGDSVAVPIRFQPTTLGPKSGAIAIITTDASVPNRIVNVSGQVPPGDVRVTGSTDFGEVCAGSLAEKTISVCNVGKCNLSVLSVAFNPPCADFTLINNPFPAIVSPDSCMDAVIRYTPTSCGAKTCTLVIQTDDPDTPIITLTVTATTPCASIDVPPDMAFPPTVISSFGPCRSLLPFPISNTGTCPLWITDIQIGGPQAAEYSMVGLPSFPIILEQGHIVGEGDFSIAFSPAVLARERHATITVTYISDPISGATASVTRQLCGEGVHTGARVLVMQGNIPVAKVEKIQLQRINANRNKDPLDTHDVIQNALLVTSVPGLPCEPFQYHREYGTVSNPIQLLPGSYQVTVAAIINGKRKSRTVGFDVETCTFNPTVVIKY